jgi:hypothetical protein
MFTPLCSFTFVRHTAPQIERMINKDSSDKELKTQGKTLQLAVDNMGIELRVNLLFLRDANL